jgi:hypothetical protein
MSRCGYLVATASSGGAAWISRHATFPVACGGRIRSMISSDRLVALCSELSYTETIGDACLKALPAIEKSKESLTRAILGDMPEAGPDRHRQS